MNTRTMRALVIMELRRFRWLFVGAIVASAASLGLMATGATGAYVGSVSFLTTALILGVLLPMLGIFQERKDNNWLFLLSLPLSAGQLALAKTVANAAVYFPGWMLITALGWLAVLALPAPDGLIPIGVALMGFLAVYYVVLFSVGLITTSQTWATATIIAGNVSFSYFMFFVARLPTVAATRLGPDPVWTHEIFAVLALELAAVVLTYAIAAARFRRKREFI